MQEYKIEAKKGEGTYSEVFTAFSRKFNKHVAVKYLKKPYQSIELIKKQKQIQALKQLSSHPNVIKLLDVLYDQPTGRLAIVFQLMEQNLYEYLKSKKKDISEAKIISIAYQALKAIDYMHKKGLFHRDIKPQNILISGDTVKLADFGSCKNFHSHQPYTEYISTRWYRAPECLLTDGYYDSKMDLWGIGCVIFELFSKFPLFPGKDQIDQIHKIHNVLGTPNQEILSRFEKNAANLTRVSGIKFDFIPKRGTGIHKLIPEASIGLATLIQSLLAYDPVERISAQEALKNSLFEQLTMIDLHKQHKRRKNQQSLQHLPPISTHISPTLAMNVEKYMRDRIKKRKQLVPGLNLSEVYSSKKYMM